MSGGVAAAIAVAGPTSGEGGPGRSTVWSRSSLRPFPVGHGQATAFNRSIGRVSDVHACSDMHGRNHLSRFLTTLPFATYRDIYSDGVEAPSSLRWLHTAGQVGLRADGSVPATFAEQCEQALLNLTAVLDAAQMSPSDIVKLTCYVVGTQDLDVLYAARRAQLRGSAPAATVIVVQALAAPELLVEIEAVAAADDTRTQPA